MSNTEKDIDLRPHHCAISVPDIERSISWYRDVLGFSLEKREKLEKIGAKVAFMARGDFRMEIFEVPGADALPDARRVPDKDLLTHGTKHVAFLTKSIDGFVEHLRQHGEKPAMGPFEVGAMKVLFINDVSGNLIELLEELPHR